MKPRQNRLAIAGGVLVSVGAIAALVFNAFQSNLVFFYSPSQVASKEAPANRTFRLGGLVESGSVKREGVAVIFVVTCLAAQTTPRKAAVPPKTNHPDVMRRPGRVPEMMRPTFGTPSAVMAPEVSPVGM